MTPTDYRAIIAALGLSQVKAAHALGISERTSRRYALGEAPVPPVVVTALRLMEENARLRKALGNLLPPPPLRGWREERDG